MSSRREREVSLWLLCGGKSAAGDVLLNSMASGEVEGWHSRGNKRASTQRRTY